MRPLTVTIDGPAGAGKSTVARALSTALGYTYIDTGAMYRAVAWRCLRDGIALDDEAATVCAARETRIRFRTAADGAQRVLADGIDITDDIRTLEVTRLSSPVSAISGVRRVLVAQQQEMGAGGGVVLEGRDTGTVVFPKADVKVFLTASEEERARRRWAERASKGDSVTMDEVLVQQRERDARDSSRADSPLRPAEDAVTLDSDGMSAEQVVERILSLCKERAAAQP